MLYQKIYFSLAGKEDEQKAIEETMRIISALNAQLTVIHINDPGAGKAHMLMDTLPRTTKEDMIDLFAKAGFANKLKDIDFRLIDDESYADAIAKATREADLLIMGHHHKNLIKAMLTDGTDERVADLMHCPVLLVPLK